jgi:hypothetical protein
MQYSRVFGSYHDFLDRGQDRQVFTTNGTYPWSFVTKIFYYGQPSHGGERKIFEVMASTLPKGTLGSVLITGFVTRLTRRVPLVEQDF